MQINNDPNATRKVSFDCKKKNPAKYAKSLTITQPTAVTHVFDYESHDPVHSMKFESTLDQMKEVNRSSKAITYKSGYSNFTFELWIVLHKADCFGSFTDRSQYLDPINKAYGEEFENLDKYKREDDFKRVLRKLSLSNVKDAVQRARIITGKNQEYGYTHHSYKGYCYYRENPSLLIWESVERILYDCGLMGR